MFRPKPLSSAIKFALGASAGTFALGLSSQVLAQDRDVEVLEEIITTGSRIPVDQNLLQTSPVTTVNSVELQYHGVTRVEDLINDLPQIVPEFTSNDSNGSTGTATLDLRGLSAKRTLVLTNGHRMGFGDPFALSPDINQIPGAMVDRIEILTGGASATYGADAVSGVVNFVMKKDFEGFQLDYQVAGYRHSNDASDAQAAVAAAGYQQAPSSVSDGKTTSINATIGANTADGRGNVTGYIGYRDIEAIRHSERDYSACALGGDGGTVGDCRGSSTTPLGSFRDFADIDLTLDEANPGTFIDRDGASYNYGPLNYFQRPDERWTAGLFGNYAMSESFEAYTEFMFMDDRSVSQIAPSGTFFNNTTLNCDNPLMSNQQRTAIGCPGVAGAMTPDLVPIYVGRRNVEGGPRFDDMQHQSNRTLLGFRGDIGQNWNYDAFVNYSRLNFTEVYGNDLSITNIIRSLDIVDDGNGTAVCRSALDGSDPACVPYDVFNVGGSTAEARAYIDLPLYSKADLDQSQAVAYVSGDLGFGLPTAGDDIAMVFGAEYRDDSMEYDLDQNYNNGNAAGQGGATADVSGTVTVKEVFTEFRIPLVQDMTGIEDLSLDLRYRYSDYSLGFDADTWSTGIAWSPVEMLKVRASMSRSVRAPNIRELFLPQTIGLWSGTDPCAGATPEFTEAECARTGVPAGSYGSVAANPADQYNGLFGGNPGLDPESSDSVTVGFVLNTEFGLTMSMDYWNIQVEDAISQIGAEFIIDECATGNDSLCGLIRRSPVNGNVWVGSGPNAPRVEQTDINIGFFEVSGVDINASYGLELADNAFDFTLRGTALTQWDDQPQPGGAINDCKGTWGGSCGRPRPEWKHTFSARWTTGLDGLDVVGTWRYISEVKEHTSDNTGRYTAPATNYLDLSAAYAFEMVGGDAMVTFGINNILDETPPYHGLLNTAAYSNGNTIPGAYDALGQYWFVALNFAY